MEVGFIQPFIYLYYAYIEKNFRIDMKFCHKYNFWRRSWICYYFFDPDREVNQSIKTVRLIGPSKFRKNCPVFQDKQSVIIVVSQDWGHTFIGGPSEGFVPLPLKKFYSSFTDSRRWIWGLKSRDNLKYPDYILTSNFSQKTQNLRGALQSGRNLAKLYWTKANRKIFLLAIGLDTCGKWAKMYLCENVLVNV